MMKQTLIAGVVCALLTTTAQAADIPQSATLNYRSNLGIPATMTFKRNGDNYTVSANINVPAYKIRFESGGKIVNGMLKPSYYRDVRNGKEYAAARFSAGQVFLGKSGDKHTQRTNATVMDLFTLSWQIAFSDGKLPAGLQVTNGKKLYRVGSLNVAGSKKMSINGVKTTVNQFTMKREDSTVQYAFASDLGNMPAVISYSDGGKRYNLTLKSAVINGVSVKPAAQKTSQ
ncbi:DUF3108 domain-containing protein [Wielerella bovis]|uniref:DUF3108 domain-containing protein n=1 Tax=Wielerella bovis TaxID=2917790 RepID=UPI003D2DDBCF